MKFIKLLSLSVILILSSCTPGTVNPTPPAESTATQPTETQATSTPSPSTPGIENDLAGTHWTLVSISEGGDEISAIEGSNVTLEFTEGGRVQGEGGCNSYGGPYEVEDDTFSVGEVVSTLMACADEQVTQQEQRYLAALQSAGEYELSGDRLTVHYGDGQGTTLNFMRSTAAAPGTTADEPAVTPSPAGQTATTTPTPFADSPEEEATRITLDTGETSTQVEATIEERGLDRYVLQAQEGQVMSVEISSPNNNVLLSVVGEDGTPYKRYQNGPPQWTSELPATQDYILHAVSVGPGTTYTLQVWIEPLTTEEPERVNFEPGTTSASRSGVLAPATIKQYVLEARAGQVMNVQTIGYGAPVGFTVREPDGEVWTGESTDGPAHLFERQISLPESGDYVVTLSAPSDAGDTEYEVTFEITATASPTAPPQAGPPARVSFAPGATSAHRDGLLPSGPGATAYVLEAAAGQIMEVMVSSPDAPVSFTIEGPNGATWTAEQFGSEVYVFSQTISLPQSGDYTVTLTKPDHTPSTTYRATFAVQ